MTNNTQFMKAALKESGHYVDHENGTIYVTKEFNKKAERYGTKECRIMDEVMKRFPAMAVTVYAPTRKARLSYEMMEMFICKMPNAEANFDEYVRLRQKNAIKKSPHKSMVDWFNKKYPYYGQMLVRNEAGEVVWDAVKMYRKAQEEEKARAATAQSNAEKPEISVSKMAEEPIENTANLRLMESDNTVERKRSRHEKAICSLAKDNVLSPFLIAGKTIFERCCRRHIQYEKPGEETR